MYEAFFGLNEKPFTLSPDPRFLYLSEKHNEAFAHLLYGIQNGNGFVMVTGEIGTGKTTICRTLLNKLDSNTEVSFIFNPCLSPDELLRNINQDFGIDSTARTIKGLIDELNNYLLESSIQGKTCVLVIDEAQNLWPQVLEQIRLLSNLETESKKLLQIVLIGQPELNVSLELPELRQLDQRITARYHLKPLSDTETLQYIAYRLRVAGGRGKVRFSRPAIRTVYRVSGGTPRVINSVSDRALLIAYTRETRTITPEIIRKAAKEIRGERVAPKQPKRAWRFLPSPSMATALVAVGILAALFIQNMNGTSGPAPAPAQPLETEAAAHQTAPASKLEEPPRTGNLVHASVPDPGERPVEVSSLPESDSALLRLLNAQDPEVARNSAAVALLRRWNTALISDYPEDNQIESLGAFALLNGFEFETLDATVDQLARIDLPGFVRVAADKHALWVALLSLHEDTVTLSGAMGVEEAVPRAEFVERYLNKAILLWRDPSPNTRFLYTDSAGGPVRALQTLLGERGLYSAPISGAYDAATEAAVVRLQQETALKVDGKAGKQTRMVLSSWDTSFETPSLVAVASATEEEGAPTQVAEAPDKPREEELAPISPEETLVEDTEEAQPEIPSAPEAEVSVEEPSVDASQVPVEEVEVAPEVPEDIVQDEGRTDGSHEEAAS